MKHKKINVDMYGFRVDVIECESEKDYDLLCKFFKGTKLKDPIVDEILDAVREGDTDGGWTLACLGAKREIIVLLPMSCEERRRIVLNHEKRHVEDDILRHCGVDDEEAAAYIAGFLSKFIY